MQNRLVNSGIVANVSEANARNLETIASLLADLLLCLNTPEDTRLQPLVVLSSLLITPYAADNTQEHIKSYTIPKVIH